MMKIKPKKSNLQEKSGAVRSELANDILVAVSLCQGCHLISRALLLLTQI